MIQPASCIFHTKTCTSTQTQGAERCIVACAGINDVCNSHETIAGHFTKPWQQDIQTAVNLPRQTPLPHTK